MKTTEKNETNTYKLILTVDKSTQTFEFTDISEAEQKGQGLISVWTRAVSKILVGHHIPTVTITAFKNGELTGMRVIS